MSTRTIVQPSVALADPHIVSDIRDRRSIIGAIYDSLVRRDDAGQFIPWLAERWELADDARTWTFALRRGVVCHNGDALEAADVAASIQRAIDHQGGELGTQGVYRSYLGGSTLTAIDTTTLQIVTPRPLADLLDLLVDIPAAPRAALATLAETPVGSGPYRLVAAEPGRVEMVAFADHWAGRPSVERLVWLGEPDAARRGELLLSGTAQLAVDVAPAIRDALATSGGETVSAPSWLCVIFLANCYGGPCADARVRRALNYALDVPALIADPQIMGGNARQLAGPLAPRHPAIDGRLAPYRVNPELARELLAAAGYGQGLALTIDLPARFPDESIALAERMAAVYAAVGVTCTLRVHEDRAAYAEMVRAKQIGDLCCFDSSPPSAYRVLREKLDSRAQGPWWQGYANGQVEALTDAAAATVDADARLERYREAMALVRDDAPWVFLYAPDYCWGVGAALAGWRPTAEGRVRLS